AAPRRGDHGRQRPVGAGAGAAADRRPRAGRALALRRRRGSHRDRGQGDLGVRLLHRELVPLRRRGPLPHGVQPRRDPAAARRDARARRPRPLGRPGPPAVAVGDQGAAGRRGDDPAQHRVHVDDVRELRRACGDRRRRPVARPGRRGRPGERRPGGRADVRPLPLRARAGRRRPGVADVGGAAAVELHAVAGGVLRDGLHRRPVARRGPPPPVAGDRHLRAPGPEVRRRRPGRCPFL
ncbi:MAG: Trans,polycis-decaprenyl diphosphate synthase, partial [uncultured Nocardioidaceae bacterium]